MVYNPDLLRTIQAEIAPAFSTGVANLELRLELYPDLEALYEVI